MERECAHTLIFWGVREKREGLEEHLEETLSNRALELEFEDKPFYNQVLHIEEVSIHTLFD